LSFEAWPCTLLVVVDEEDVPVLKEQQEVGEEGEQKQPQGCVGSQQGWQLVLWVEL
jgi:hypothetical protein